MALSRIRWSRLTTSSGAMLMLPLDHGISVGPIAGIEDVAHTLEGLAGAGASCVTVHKGLLPAVAGHARGLGVLLHLSASTDHAPDPNDKRLVATVHEAARLGGDGVSIHVNLGSLTEARQVEEAGRVATECGELGMPLVAMVYPRGPKVKDPRDPALVAHAARLGAELGADAVKVPFTGDAASFRDVVRGCPVPVLVAGGPKRDSFAAMLKDLKAARQAGAGGVSVGRNVFQAKDPAQAMRQVAAVWG